MSGQEQSYRPPLWVINAPITGWWLGMVGLVIVGNGPMAIAWFLSGLLMLTNCVLAAEAEANDNATEATT